MHVSNNPQRALFFRHTLLFVLLLSCLIPLSAQGWTFNIFSSGFPGVTRNDLTHLPDFFNERIGVPGLETEATDIMGFMMHRADNDGWLGSGGIPDPISGTLTWERSSTPKASLMSEGDTLYTIVDNALDLNSPNDVLLLRFYPDTLVTQNNTFVRDRVKWYEPILEDENIDYTAASIQHGADRKLMVLATARDVGTGNGNGNVVFSEVDRDGNVLWSNTYSTTEVGEAVQFARAADGGYYILKNSFGLSPATSRLYLLKVSADGTLEWDAMIDGQAGDRAADMRIGASDELVIAGQNANQQIMVLKLDAEGELLWRQDYASNEYQSVATGLVIDASGNIAVSGQLDRFATGIPKSFMVKLTGGGTPLWERDYGPDHLEASMNDIVLTPVGDYLMGGFRQLQSTTQSTAAYYVKTDTFGLVYGGNISGNVFADFDFNCDSTTADIPLEDWLVEVHNDTLSFVGYTDEQGNYAIPVFVTRNGEVDYIVEIQAPSNYWNSCENTVPVTIEYLDTLTVNFPMQALVDCPFMQIDISSTNFRICDTTTLYFQYCNNGTAIAEDAQVEVFLPPELTFLNAAIEPTVVTDSSYVFSVGDLGINECGILEVNTLIICDEEFLFQTVCVRALVTPDTICEVPGSNWTGALIHAGYVCEDDNIQFSIENVGDAGMATELEYVIIEDAVLLLQGTFDLDPEQELLPDVVPINGSTYTLIAQQEPGAPTAQIISLGTAGCGEGSHGSLGEIQQNSGDIFEDIFCPVLVGAYDPNDKQAFPTGLGEEHGILANTDLQYLIRFQNLGNDTAFRVIIRDTIAEELDLGTFEPGPSSHPYSWRFEERALIFNFYGIELPDSTTNPQASQGFVSFRIAQQKDLPVGTLIENQAGIYFDFNSPVITNTVFHTVIEFIDIINGSVTVQEPEWEVRVAPNPMSNGATISLQGGDFTGQDLELQLLDVTGRVLRSQRSQNSEFWLDRAGLAAGIYFFRITNRGEQLATGKLVVQ